MGLRQRADDNGAFGHARPCRDRVVFAIRLTGKDQLGVDLVRDHPEVVFERDGCDRSQLVLRGNHAGRVGRRVHHDRLCPLGDRGSDRFGIEPEAVIQTSGYERGSPDAQGGFVGEVGGVGDDDLVAGLDQAQRGVEKGVLGPGAHDHVGRVVVHTREFPDVAGDGRADTGTSGNVGVVGVTAVERFDRPVDDACRRPEIGVADAQDNHILAPSLRLAGGEVDGPALGALAPRSIDQ